MTRRLKVLLLPSDPPSFWEKEVIRVVNPHHDLTYFNYENSPDPQFQGVEVVIDLAGSKRKREMADLAVSIQLWQLVATGFDTFELDYWREKQIPVANTPGPSSAVALAECALMFMMMLSRRWPETQSHLKQRIVGSPMGVDLVNRRLGLIGFGASAIELARRAKSFSMKISAIDVRSVSLEEQQQLGVDFVGGPGELDDVIRQSDFLSLHIHLNQETRYLMDKRRFSLMKPSAFLINVARGALVDESALYQALIEGKLAGAGLDVFAQEPIDPESSLLSLPNVVGAPHIAGQTERTAQHRAAMVAENLDRLAHGLEPLYRIDQ